MATRRGLEVVACYAGCQGGSLATSATSATSATAGDFRYGLGALILRVWLETSSILCRRDPR
jgi:hypothetical protein